MQLSLHDKVNLLIALCAREGQLQARKLIMLDEPGAVDTWDDEQLAWVRNMINDLHREIKNGQ